MSDAFMDMVDVPLFEMDAPPPIALADRFGIVPPLSILDRRSGMWQDRRRRWLSLGIASDVGRGGNLTFAKGGGVDEVTQKLSDVSGGTSIFDPVLCELAYRWFTAPGDRILDPFAGGSVRGVVASVLGRSYDGVDIRDEQVEANRAQAHLGGPDGPPPMWFVGDATNLGDVTDLGLRYDLIFTCPPYADLEVYSDHPRDISTWSWDDFVTGQGKAIAAAVARLTTNRFAVWVTSDLRDKRGVYRGLRDITVAQFAAAGMDLLNDAVIVDRVATAALRAAAPFVGSRKLTRTHQHLLVFVKGSAKAAAGRINASEGVRP